MPLFPRFSAPGLAAVLQLRRRGGRPLPKIPSLIHEIPLSRLLIVFFRQEKLMPWKWRTKFSDYSGAVGKSVERERPPIFPYFPMQDRRGQRPRLHAVGLNDKCRALSLARRSSWPSRFAVCHQIRCRVRGFYRNGLGPYRLCSSPRDGFGVCFCLMPNFGLAWHDPWF